MSHIKYSMGAAIFFSLLVWCCLEAYNNSCYISTDKGTLELIER